MHCLINTNKIIFFTIEMIGCCMNVFFFVSCSMVGYITSSARPPDSLFEINLDFDSSNRFWFVLKENPFSSCLNENSQTTSVSKVSAQINIPIQRNKKVNIFFAMSCFANAEVILNEIFYIKDMQQKKIYLRFFSYKIDIIRCDLRHFIEDDVSHRIEFSKIE
jgi:hypothetical protein